MTDTLIGRLPGVDGRWNGRGSSRHVLGTVSAIVRHHPVVVISTIAAATVGVGALSLARSRRDADLELLAGTDS